MLIILQDNKNLEHDDICFGLRLLQVPFGDSSHQLSMPTEPCWAAALRARLSAQKFKRERKTAEGANTESADLLAGLILVFPVFAVNISFTMTLAVTS